MQARRTWQPPSGVLGRLTDAARSRSRALMDRTAELEAAARAAAVRPRFATALRRADVAVIAELKRRSPSKGALHPTMDAVERASGYATGGAAALSILTEPSEFGGALSDLQDVRSAVSIPLLRKDFIVSPQQVVEARGAGASAVLLIARSLGPEDLRELATVARDWGLDTLIEIRDEDELAWAVEARADVIGVNTRNLETLAVDAAVAERLVPMIPATVPAVFESGVRDRGDVALAGRVGADAVLVGSSLSVQPDPVAAVAALVGVPRTGRGGAA